MYKRIKYPDGGIYAKLDLDAVAKQVASGEPIVITERINSYEDLFFLKSLKDALDYNKVEKVELEIPCMFQQQHDRRFNDSISYELVNVCDFINSCNFYKVHVFHPHSDVTGSNLKNIRIIDNSNFIRKVLDNIPGTPILLSTDAGSFKWISPMADKLNFEGELYSASKVHKKTPEGHSLVQVIDRKDFEGKDILVVDDLCVFGGTFVGLAKMLKERNAGKLYLAVSHITVKNPNIELETLYEKIYCTNSKYEASEYQLSNLEVIKLF
jgi:ribose-phosphate pyrophosphokinase